MAGDLASEDGAFLTHAVLEERMADAIDERDAACAFDRLRDSPARADVVEDLRARFLLEDRLCEKCRGEVTGNELAGVVDEETAVGISVEGDTEIGPVSVHLLDDELTVFGEQWVRLVVREGRVRLEEVRHRIDRQALENWRQHDSAHTVRSVDHDAERLHGVDVDEGQDGIDPARPDVLLSDMSGGLTLGHVLEDQSPCADVQQTRVTPDGKRAAAHDLQAGVVLWVVRSGDHDSALEVEVTDGEIEHLGSDHPDIDDVGAGV